MLRDVILCRQVIYCTKSCQISHWKNHKVLCSGSAIKQLEIDKKSQVQTIFQSNLTPKEHAKVAKLVGRRCNLNILLNGKQVNALWDTGAQVSIVSNKWLKRNFPLVKDKNVSEILGEEQDLNIAAANGIYIPFAGFLELKFELGQNKTDSSVFVPMLEQQLIGFNVIEQLTKNYENIANMSNAIDKSYGTKHDINLRGRTQVTRRKPSHPPLSLGSNEINTKSEHKHLGLTLDSKLNFESQRRWYQRLCHFFNVKKSQSPHYWFAEIPDERKLTYNLRATHAYNQNFGRTVHFSNTYFQNTLLEWNLLCDDVKHYVSIAEFKRKLLAIIRPLGNSIYNIHDGVRSLTKL